MSTSKQNPPADPNPFEKSANSRSRGIFTEFLYFVMQNKKWWLIPIIFILLLLGAMIILGGTAAGPFIYTLF
jgi:hypothetical protein